MSSPFGFGIGDIIGQVSALFQGASDTSQMDETFVVNYFAQEDLQTLEFQEQLDNADKMEQNKMYLSLALFVIIVSLLIYITVKK